MAWTSIAAVMVVVAGSSALGAAMASGSGTTSARDLGPRSLPAVAPAPGVTTPTMPPGPPNPPAPGPLAVDGSAWAGHGSLAFVSEGQLEVLSDAGRLTEITGPTGEGTDSNPSWSANGRWLAFLHTGPAVGFDIPSPTLWLVAAGASVATEVGTSGLTMYAWSPVTSLLAFIDAPTNSTVATSSQQLWLDSPGAPPKALELGTGSGIGEIAWSPDGTSVAFDEWVVAQPATDGQPIGWIGVAPIDSAPVTNVYQLSGSGLFLAGWWPSGGGLLFWEDPGFAESADGQSLYSLAVGASQPALMATSLVGPTWLAPSPIGNEVAIVSGGGRTIWNAGRTVTVCRFPEASCSAIAVPAGTVGLAPSWSSSGELFFSVASAAGPFAPLGTAYYSPGWMAQWNATNVLMSVDAAGQSAPVSSAPPGALYSVPSNEGASLLVVADDALWLANPVGAPATEVAGPLYSTAGPAGYYGEVDWKGTFAWSEGAGVRQGSTELLGQSLGGETAQLP
jgi:hypothetical protein